MKILIISGEVWRHDTNGGNNLSNMFEDFDAEFAQIYCSPGLPSNNVCKKYYQITDMMVLKNIFKKEKAGRIIEFINFPNDDNAEGVVNNKSKLFYAFFKMFNLPIFYVFKEFLWKISSWKNKNLERFVREFNPDIVFAPSYGNIAMLELDRHVAKITKKPLISAVSDDIYLLKHINFSFVFWAYRYFLRRSVRKTYPYYSLVYTMTEEQLTEYSRALKCKMKILRKGVDIATIPTLKKISYPIKLVYAGGIYVGRDKTLLQIVKALKKINSERVLATLNIYTGSELNKKTLNILNDGRNSFVNDLIHSDELKLKYKNSHIALHIESFKIKYRLLTRLSFSTKIVDCISSGCAVMAICWNGHSGYKYLKREDAAICVDNKDEIYSTLANLVNDPNIIQQYAIKAFEASKRHHNQKDVNQMINSDFKAISRKD